MKFEGEATKRIFSERMPAVFLLTDDFNSEEMTLFSKVAKNRKGDMIFSYSDTSHKLANFVGVSKGDKPAFRIIGFVAQAPVKYQPESSELTEESLNKFIDMFLSKKLSPFYKSEAVPGPSDEPVLVVVGNSFEQVVFNSN